MMRINTGSQSPCTSDFMSLPGSVSIPSQLLHGYVEIGCSRALGTRDLLFPFLTSVRSMQDLTYWLLDSGCVFKETICLRSPDPKRRLLCIWIQIREDATEDRVCSEPGMEPCRDSCVRPLRSSLSHRFTSGRNDPLTTGWDPLLRCFNATLLNWTKRLDKEDPNQRKPFHASNEKRTHNYSSEGGALGQTFMTIFCQQNWSIVTTICCRLQWGKNRHGAENLGRVYTVKVGQG